MEGGEHIVVASGGLSFISILQIAFIVLKLCGVISWHWALVMLPLIISVGLPFILLVTATLIYFFISLFYHNN